MYNKYWNKRKWDIIRETMRKLEELKKNKVKIGDIGYCNNPYSYHYATDERCITIAGFKEECGRSCVDCEYFKLKRDKNGNK